MIAHPAQVTRGQTVFPRTAVTVLSGRGLEFFGLPARARRPTVHGRSFHAKVEAYLGQGAAPETTMTLSDVATQK
jgi:hypothetical protein